MYIICTPFNYGRILGKKKINTSTRYKQWTILGSNKTEIVNISFINAFWCRWRAKSVKGYDRGDGCGKECDSVEGVRGTSEERVQELPENDESDEP